MALAAQLVQSLPSVYGWAKRQGLLDNVLLRRGFAETYFLYKRWLEDPFHGLVRSRPGFFRNGHVLDVGANIGYTACVFQGALDPGFRVYAFEPELANYRLLEESIRSRKVEGEVVPIHAAVGAHAGTLELWHNDGHHGDHRIVTPHFAPHVPGGLVASVPVVALDGFVRDRGLQSVSFIKIDVQGYELPVCQGMTRVLEENPQVIVAVEYAPDGLRELGFDPEELLAFFRAREHVLHVLGRTGTLRRLDFDQVGTVVAEKGYFDLVFSRSPLA